MRFFLVAATVIVGAAGNIASAEIVDATPQGFTLVEEITVAGKRSAAWSAAVEHVDQWWNPEHTISGDASLLSIDAHPLGCFCEAAGGGVVHLMVTSVSRDVMLRMTGGLGPLGLMGVNGNMTWEFFDVEEGTKIRFAYAVGGYAADGLDSIAPAVDRVVADALARLRDFIDGS